MYICAVHIQVLQKSKTVCFTSCSKGTYVILPSEQRLWSSFPAEDGSSTVLSLTLAGSSSTENRGGRWPDSLLTPEGGALWTIWRNSGLITRETEQNCEADGREQKAILVWGEISPSAPQADVATGLTRGPDPGWRQVQFAVGADTQFIHCLPRVGGTRWRRGKGAGRQFSQPDRIRVQKYLGEKKPHFTSF